MNTFQKESTNSNKLLRLLGWILGLLFILKALDFFLSINLTTESELSPVILEAVLFFVSGVAMLLLAIGTIRLARWVRIPLYLVFVSNILFIIYRTLLVPNLLDASISLIGAVVLFFYLKKIKSHSRWWASPWTANSNSANPASSYDISITLSRIYRSNTTRRFGYAINRS